MIKRSACSYLCGIKVSPDFFPQLRLLDGIAQSTSCVALAGHTAMNNTPNMGNMNCQ